jgi:Uma2 family endonuclease
MIANPSFFYMTAEEYLQWEETQPIKHEYINGEIFAMTGGTLNHNSITLNIASSLKTHLKGKGCKVFMSDAKVKVSEKGPFFYPDVMVTCDQRDKKSSQVVAHPSIIIEVLSPSTKGFDRGDKFKFYRQMDSLKEYVLIETESINIDVFRVNESGFWELHSYKENQDLILSSINFQCPMSLIYEDIEFGDN